MTVDDDIDALVEAMRDAEFTPRNALTAWEVPWYGARAPEWDDVRNALRQQFTRDDPRPESLDHVERKIRRH